MPRPTTPEQTFIDGLRYNKLALAEIQRLVEEENVPLGTLDQEGNCVLHWATWFKNLALLEYCLAEMARENPPYVKSVVDVGSDTEEEKAAERPIKLHTNHKNGRQQTPIHWAVMQGDLHAIVTLIQHGADLTTADEDSFSVAHFAAQYGHAAVLDFLSFRTVDLSAADKDGRTPLHWAAYKGHNRCVVLLIRKLGRHSRDGGARSVDHRNFAPIHMAAAMNRRQCVAGLLGSLNEFDFHQTRMKSDNNQTALDIALAKGNAWTTTLLESIRDRHEGRFSSLWSWLDVATRMSYHPTAHSLHRAGFGLTSYFLVMLALHFFHNIYMASVLGVDWSVAAVALLVVLDFFLWYRTWSAVPDVVPSMTPPPRTSEDDVEAGLLESSNLATYEQCLSLGMDDHVCTTCGDLRPVRSKHCQACNRCVLGFDHHCPWIGSCVASHNHGLFVGFLVVLFALCFPYLLNCYNFFSSAGLVGPGIFAFTFSVYLTVHAVIFSLYVGVLAAQHVYLVSVNLTTNEMINKRRYSYLVNSSTGKFFNSFDLGLIANWAMALGMSQDGHVHRAQWQKMPTLQDLQGNLRQSLERRLELFEKVQQSHRAPAAVSGSGSCCDNHQAHVHDPSTIVSDATDEEESRSGLQYVVGELTAFPNKEVAKAALKRVQSSIEQVTNAN